MVVNSHVTIGLLWHSLVSGNLGVGALTESNIAIIRQVAESQGVRVRFVILGSGEGVVDVLRDELRVLGHDLECHRARVFNRGFVELIKKCDLVVDIGEGDSFSDIYGFKRFFFYWLSKNIVCFLKKPLLLAPQTIGPFNGFFSRIMARQVMDRCVKVFSRDDLSRIYLSDLGVVSNVIEATDVAFFLPFERSGSVSSGVVNVGINISGLLYNGGYTGKNQFGLSVNYPRVVRRIVNFFCDKPDVRVHLIAHVIEPGMPVEDDFRVCKALSDEFSGAIVSPEFLRPSDAKSYISNMDFFVGARMHSCVAAFSSGVPVVPMSYSRKFKGLFGSLGFFDIADCQEDSEDRVFDRVVRGFNDRDLLAKKIRVSLEAVEGRIFEYKNVLAEAISQ